MKIDLCVREFPNPVSFLLLPSQETERPLWENPIHSICPALSLCESNFHNNLCLVFSVNSEDNMMKQLTASYLHYILYIDGEWDDERLKCFLLFPVNVS